MDQLFFLDLLWIDKLSANLPISIANRFAIGTKLMDLEKVESSVLILQKVANEAIQRTLVPRIDVHLSKYLVNRINCIDSMWIRIRHAFDADSVSITVCIHCEQILHHVLRETVV